MASLILRYPLLDLLARNVARRGKRPRVAVQTRRKKKQEFLLLLWRQAVGSLFDLGKRAHAALNAVPGKVSQPG